MEKEVKKGEKIHNGAGKKKITGTVISDKMEKTIVVAVDIFKTHPKYLKKYKSTKNYKVHDEKNKYKVGDKVEFTNSKPISKGKRFIVL
ncbi:MAG: 30S ribosomal protein S17 [Candidatus Moranbacteria bacterium]|jgi:small subunit ribosomal protein S17|nr:30S ribosomal protein S17 [Candidatus Moranbacteria bacterium]MDD5652521.1 30S ribosomal protein S17 [Candidatus Moranbacteria bacterium]MDX9855638.1 30S ribosomal protein S17 [Candidatus Moranbacteria bacterium]